MNQEETGSDPSPTFMLKRPSKEAAFISPGPGGLLRRLLSPLSGSERSKLIFLIILLTVTGSALVSQQFMGASSSSKKNMSQPPVIVQAKENATAVLIFLHGLGDTGHGWGELFRDLSLKNIRCIFPHAPVSSVSLNAGMTMPSWFDIKGLTPNSPEDEQGVKESSKKLQQIIAEEVKKGIPAERIFIGGFSQGGAVAMYTAFGTDTPVGGLLALSAWIPLHKYFADESKKKYNMNVPVLQCHGQVDPMVSYIWGKASNEIIKKFNPDAVFKSFGSLGHGSSPQEMKDVKAFLEEHLKDS